MKRRKNFKKYLKKRLNKKKIQDIDINTGDELETISQDEIDKITDEIIKKYSPVLEKLAKT